MRAWLGKPVRRGTLIAVVVLGLLLLGGLLAIALTAGRDVVREQIVYEAIEDDPARTANALRPELDPRFEELEKRISAAKGFSEEELAELEREIGVDREEIYRAIRDNPDRVAASLERALEPSPQAVQDELDALCRELQSGDDVNVSC